MGETIQRWRVYLDAHWQKGGGAIAARLWWLAFCFIVFSVAVFVQRGTQVNRRKMSEFTSLSNLEQVGAALNRYTQDHDALPTMTDFASTRHALDAYSAPDDATTNESVWQTPNLRSPYAVNTSLSRHLIRAYRHPDKIVAVWDTRLWHRELRIVAFLDGHVESIGASAWEHLRTDSGVTADTPAPCEPVTWWESHFDNKSTDQTVIILSFGAFTAAVLAAWRESWRRAQTHRDFWSSFVWCLCVRFVGYGLLVLLASLFVGAGLGVLLDF